MGKLIAAFERGGSASQISLFLRLMQKKDYKKRTNVHSLFYSSLSKNLEFQCENATDTFFGLSSNIHLERMHELNFLIKLYTVRSR